MPELRIVGPGRAGGALARALSDVAGWTVREVLGRGDDLARAADGVDLVVLAVPDAAVAEVARIIEPRPGTVIVHLAGSLGLDVLAPHERRASVHPLVAIPDAGVGARRLTSGAFFAVAGDPSAATIVDALGGRRIEVPDESRPAYHAAACIASNHLVALLGQVERVAAAAGVPLAAYLDLVRATVDNVEELGPRAALTGPVARGDHATIASHLAALDPAERPAYEAMAAAAARLLPVLAGESGAMAADPPARTSWGLRAVDTVDGLRKELDAARASGQTVGLVPTMGYLHEGHASLMERARAECDLVVATIFVNPLQFGPTEDLAAYPRDLERDRALAEACGVDLLFTPSVDEMYPGGAIATSVSVAGVSEGFEGASRPGHFAGVATVVAKLFAIAGPCRAYFGEKDFQQLAVIRRMARDLSLPVEVVGCPTVREHDGLALSSRNVYLTAEERAAAPILHRALLAGAAAITAGERDPAAVHDVMKTFVDAEPVVELDYAEAVTAADLTVPPSLSGEVRLLIAARLGRARLIDNLGVTC